MYNTSVIIRLDTEIKAANWNPYVLLDIDIPKNLTEGFNDPAIKKAYRKKALKYHPDRIARMPEAE